MVIDYIVKIGLCQFNVLEEYILDTFEYFCVKPTGVIYSKVWCGLWKLYSTNHSVKLLLKIVIFEVELPSCINSSFKVLLNLSQTGLSLPFHI